MKVIYFISCLFLLPLWLFGQQKIAYLSNQSGNFDIFIIDENGNNKKQLTQNKGWDWAPQWNTHLKAILFNSNDTTNQFSIRCKTVEGVEKSIDTKGLESFNLSPMGDKVLYTLKDLNNNYIGLLDLKEESNQLIITHSSYNGRPMWSPDGTHFSFISDRDGNSELYIYNLEKGISHRLTKSPKREKYTTWSPDGRFIFYTYHYSDEKDKEHNDIFKVEIASKAISQITDDLHFYQEIAVSPNGEKIVFHGKRNNLDHIYTIQTDGKKERQITKVGAYHGEPIWIPQF